MKKIILTTLCFFGLTSMLFLVQCSLCDCSGTPKFFNITGVSNVYHVEKGVLLKFKTVHVVRSEYDGVAIEFTPEYVGLNQRNEWNLTNALYACSCVNPGYCGSNQSIEEVFLITRNEIQGMYSRGDTIVYVQIDSIRPLSNGENRCEDEQDIRRHSRTTLIPINILDYPVGTILEFDVNIVLDNGEEFVTTTRSAQIIK